MGVYARKLSRGLRFFFSGQFLGQKYWSKAVYHTKQEARTAERDKLLDIERRQKFPNRITLKEAMEKRLDNIKLHHNKDYYKENRRYYKMFLDFAGDIDVSKISRVLVYDFLDRFAKDLNQREKGNWKANSCLRCLKALFNDVIDAYELPMKNPVKGIKFYPVRIKVKRIPTDEELVTIRNQLNEGQRFLFDFVEQTGARIMEAVRLKWEDIKGGQVTLYTRKAKNSDLTPRIIPLPDCLKGMAGKGDVFKDWNEYPRFMKDGWHVLRHRRASIWANSGMSLIEIMHRLGHSNLSTTQKYLQLLGFTFR